MARLLLGALLLSLSLEVSLQNPVVVSHEDSIAAGENSNEPDRNRTSLDFLEYAPSPSEGTEPVGDDEEVPVDPSCPLNINFHEPIDESPDFVCDFYVLSLVRDVNDTFRIESPMNHFGDLDFSDTSIELTNCTRYLSDQLILFAERDTESDVPYLDLSTIWLMEASEEYIEDLQNFLDRCPNRAAESRSSGKPYRPAAKTPPKSLYSRSSRPRPYRRPSTSGYSKNRKALRPRSAYPHHALRRIPYRAPSAKATYRGSPSSGYRKGSAYVTSHLARRPVATYGGYGGAAKSQGYGGGSAGAYSTHSQTGYQKHPYSSAHSAGSSYGHSSDYSGGAYRAPHPGYSAHDYSTPSAYGHHGGPSYGQYGESHSSAYPAGNIYGTRYGAGSYTGASYAEHHGHGAGYRKPPPSNYHGSYNGGAPYGGYGASSGIYSGHAAAAGGYAGYGTAAGTYGGHAAAPAYGAYGLAPASGGYGTATGYLGSGAAPAYGGSGSAPAYSGPGSAPAYGGSKTTPGYGGSVSGPAYGGSGSGPAYSESAAAYGGSASGPAYGASASAPAYGGSGSASAYGGPGAAPAYSGSGAAPAYSGSGSAPAYAGSGAAPAYGGSGSAPAYGGSGTAPAYGGSGTAPAYSGSGSAPAYGGSGAAPAYTEPGAAPAYSGSGAAPAYGGSGAAPAYGESGAAPAYGGSGSAPAYSGSGAAPAYGGSASAPGYGESGAGPAYGGPGSAPAYGESGAAPAYSGPGAAPAYGGPGGSGAYGGAAPGGGYGGPAAPGGYGGSASPAGYGRPLASGGYGGPPVPGSYNQPGYRAGYPRRRPTSYGPYQRGPPPAYGGPPPNYPLPGAGYGYMGQGIGYGNPPYGQPRPLFVIRQDVYEEDVEEKNKLGETLVKMSPGALMKLWPHVRHMLRANNSDSMNDAMDNLYTQATNFIQRQPGLSDGQRSHLALAAVDLRRALYTGSPDDVMGRMSSISSTLRDANAQNPGSAAGGSQEPSRYLGNIIVDLLMAMLRRPGDVKHSLNLIRNSLNNQPPPNYPSPAAAAPGQPQPGVSYNTGADPQQYATAAPVEETATGYPEVVTEVATDYPASTIDPNGYPPAVSPPAPNQNDASMAFVPANYADMSNVPPNAEVSEYQEVTQ